MNAQERGIRGAGQGRLGLGEPDVRPKLGKLDALADAPVLIENGLSQAVEAEAAAALPVLGLRYATLFPVNDLAQPWGAVRHRVLAHFNADVAAAHFVGHGGGCAGAEEGL